MKSKSLNNIFGTLFNIFFSCLYFSYNISYYYLLNCINKNDNNNILKYNKYCTDITYLHTNGDLLSIAIILDERAQKTL